MAVSKIYVIVNDSDVSSPESGRSMFSVATWLRDSVWTTVSCHLYVLGMIYS